MRGPATMWRTMVAAAAVLLAGCAGGLGSGKLLEPSVQVNRVTVRGLGLQGGNLDLKVAVYNPNGLRLNGLRLDLGFDVDGAHVGDAVLADRFVLEKRDTSYLTVPLRFTWAGAGAAFRSALAYGDLPYTVKGTVTFDAGDLKAVAFPFERSGRAPLSRSDR